ncbi:putative RNA-directed DNA polymerase, eukaryota, reverse transcriptase zinc-binding domain protein [Tanacetum coccineum]
MSLLFMLNRVKETQPSNLVNTKSVQLCEEDLIIVEHTSTVIMVKVKDIDTISNMYHICHNEGFLDGKINYVGGLWVWIQFTSAKSCEVFKSNDSLNKLWTFITVHSPSFVVDERIIWIEINGLPFIQISNDLDSNDFDDDCGFEEHRSTNEDDDSNATLDDFVQKSVEKEDGLKEPSQVYQSDGSTSTTAKYDATNNEKATTQLADDNPPTEAVHNNKENIVDEEVSDFSKSSGFENFVKENNDCAKSSNTLRTGKCSTSFGNYKRKELKGFSFIDEMNRMIEVGGALGYDVRGCKKSLRRLINGIVQETKMTKLELFQLRSMWGNFNFDYACSMTRGRSGGLVTIWDPNVFIKKRMWCGDNYIIIGGERKNLTKYFYIINVYGPQHQPDKSILWSFLRNFILIHTGKVILFSDLHEVRSESERFGSIFSNGDATIFNSFIHETGLIDLPMGGRKFTWMNKAGSKMSKLDRFLISDDVIQDLPNLQVVALDKMWSDHNPILFHSKKHDFGLTLFKIFHSWFDRLDFEDIVKEKWAVITGDLSCPIKPLHSKLKDLKSHLKVWFAHTKEVELSRRKSIVAELRSLEQKINDGHATDKEKIIRTNRLKELDDLEKIESIDLAQKARVKWEVDGDENSRFFHGLINKSLEVIVSMDEIRTAVWECGSNKAPGPDGYFFMFIKRFWDLLKHDIQEFVASFFATSKFPQGANSAFITLIPKVSKPLFIKDYRPISLIGLHYKIVAKILANRLSKVIDSINCPEQSAFISGRQILDDPLILSEIVDWYKKRKKKLMLFKIDFEKAFFVTSILINGSPTSEFSLRKSLRQGDSLSPFLFIIVIEGLHMALNDAMATNMFHGVKISSSNIHLSHLFYADDVIILSEWNQKDMENIIRILNVFHIASGLKINIQKSNVFGVVVSHNEIVSMATCTGCEAGAFPFSYLGLPIGSNMSRIASWQTLIDRFKARMSSWKANLLSIGGRLTLIKSVLGSLGNYYFSIFTVLELVIKSLESLHAIFFWGGHENNKKIAWVKWSNILASFDKGGLGVGSLKAFNKALLLKWRWRLFNFPKALWVQVVKALHGEEAGMDFGGCQSNGVWAKIVGTINHLHSSGDEPLYIRYNRLFHVAMNKYCSILDRIVNGSWDWDLSRPITMARTKTEFDKLIIDIANLDSDHMVDSDSCVWNLSIDGSFSVNMVRKHIDKHFLLSLAPSTRLYKMIPKKLNRMPIPSSHVTRLLQLFELGLVFPSQILAPVKIGLPGLIRDMLLRKKISGLLHFRCYLLESLAL